MIDLTQMSIHMPLGLYLCFLSLTIWILVFYLCQKQTTQKNKLFFLKLKKNSMVMKSIHLLKVHSHLMLSQCLSENLGGILGGYPMLNGWLVKY
jgi:hypothetical protein